MTATYEDRLRAELVRASRRKARRSPATTVLFLLVLFLVAVNVHAVLVLLEGRPLPSDPVELGLELFLGAGGPGR